MPGCKPGNADQRWVVTAAAAIGGGNWVAIGVAGAPGAPPALCVAAHADGREELLLQKCTASDHGQHWSAVSATTAGSVITSRLI